MVILSKRKIERKLTYFLVLWNEIDFLLATSNCKWKKGENLCLLYITFL